MRARLEESAQDRHLSRGPSEAREKALGEGVPVRAKALGQECERRPVGWSRRWRRGWGRTSGEGDHGQDLASTSSEMGVVEGFEEAAGSVFRKRHSDCCGDTDGRSRGQEGPFSESR